MPNCVSAYGALNACKLSFFLSISGLKMKSQVTVKGLVLPDKRPLRVFRGSTFVRYAYYDGRNRRLIIVEYVPAQKVSRIIIYQPVMSYRKAMAILRGYFP